MDYKQMEYNKPDKKILISWVFARIIKLLVIGAIMSVILYILSHIEFFESYMHYGYIFAGIIFLYLLVTIFLYPAIEYRQWRYLITEDRVEIRHGIFFITNTIIPIVRIQYITITQGPIIRKLRISIVNIHTASGQFAIEGISNETAGFIAEGLKSKLYKRLEDQEQ